MYRDILDKNLVTFEHDGDPKHTAKESQLDSDKANKAT